MLDLCNKLVDNNLSKENLLEKIEIRKTSEEDFEKICMTLTKAFGLSSTSEAAFQLLNSNAKLNESVKIVDKENGDIYGLLIFCQYPIQIGSPIKLINENLSMLLENFSQLNGHSFVIDERLRNCGLDKKMLLFNTQFIKDNYDFLWIGVENTLRSHNYWKRLGFIEIFQIEEATFYMIPLSHKFIKNIFGDNL